MMSHATRNANFCHPLSPFIQYLYAIFRHLQRKCTVSALASWVYFVLTELSITFFSFGFAISTFPPFSLKVCPPQKAVCFTSFHVELSHPYSQRSQHSHYTSQRHAKTSTVPECWSDPSGSFLAALVSFKVSSDVEPPAPQVKSVKSGPKASSSSSSAAKSQKCRPGVTNVTKRHASAMHGQCVSGIVRPQKHTEVYFHKPLRYDFIDT